MEKNLVKLICVVDLATFFYKLDKFDFGQSQSAL
jgi:hypothetical protein